MLLPGDIQQYPVEFIRLVGHRDMGRRECKTGPAFSCSLDPAAYGTGNGSKITLRAADAGLWDGSYLLRVELQRLHVRPDRFKAGNREWVDSG